MGCEASCEDNSAIIGYTPCGLPLADNAHYLNPGWFQTTGLEGHTAMVYGLTPAPGHRQGRVLLVILPENDPVAYATGPLALDYVEFIGDTAGWFGRFARQKIVLEASPAGDASQLLVTSRRNDSTLPFLAFAHRVDAVTAAGYRNAYTHNQAERSHRVLKL